VAVMLRQLLCSQRVCACDGLAASVSLEECVLLFESLDTAEENVFFHCDQVSTLD
jgi:hypothetical protein